MCMAEFFNLQFWQGFIGNLGATSLGILIGVPVALLVDRMIKASRSKNEERDLVIAIKHTLERNDSLLEAFSQNVMPNTIVYNNLDLALLDSTARRKYEILGDVSLSQQIDSVRYELQHIYRWLDLLLSITHSTFASMSNYQETRERLSKLI